MTATRRTLLSALALAPLLIATGCAPSGDGQDGADAVTTVYLVRHAEKTAKNIGDATDPALTPDGQARADALATRLAGAGLTHIHSSDTRRTRDTAAPIAAATGLTVGLYDPRDLPGMAETLRATPGTHLVVGHSNTTPQLVEALGGEPGAPIVEATEYDRLYTVRLMADGTVDSMLDRFGATSPR